MIIPKVMLGDGIAGLWGLTAGCVDLVLSDLPSGETQAEFDNAPDLDALFAATWHALKPDGVAVFMASSLRFAAACMTAGGKSYRYDLIWEKSIPSGHLNAKKRPMRSHEFVLLFYQKPGFYAPQMRETGVPLHTTPSKVRSENYGAQAAEFSRDLRKGETTRNPNSVITFGSVPNCPGGGRKHPQQKPESLLRWLVRSYSRPGELVVDPFAGSGSTLASAEAEGRRSIGWDSSPRFGS